MDTNKDGQKTPGKKPGGPKGIAQSFIREPGFTQQIGPEEFEEDLSMDLRMKSQPLGEDEINSTGTPS